MKDFFADMSEIVVEQEPLGRYTAYGVGGPARWLARPRSVEELARLVGRCAAEDIPVYTLGRGANLLVSDDGVDGMVIRLVAPVFSRVEWPTSASGAEVSGTVVVAGGGADMYRLVTGAVRRGLGGLEGLAGIPGKLGGIVRMNAGGRWGQIADVVDGLTVVDGRGEIRWLSADQAGFGYRRSNLADMVICDVALELIPGEPATLFRRFREIWSSKSRRQPMAEASAGCVFKNPEGGNAGALIDQAGLKGRSVGGARVSEVHANFIVVQPGVTAEDIFSLIGVVRREVAQRFGVELDLEIEIWGRRRVSVGEPAL